MADKKKNFDRALNLDTSAVLRDMEGTDPALAARMVAEGLVEAPTPPLSLKLVPPVHGPDDDSLQASSAGVELANARIPTTSKRPERNKGQIQKGPERVASDAKITGRRGIVTRADGREVARLFCYVEPELYRDVRVYCAKHDVSISDLVNSVLVDALRFQLSKDA